MKLLIARPRSRRCAPRQRPLGEVRAELELLDEPPRLPGTGTCLTPVLGQPVQERGGEKINYEDTKAGASWPTKSRTGSNSS